MKRLRARVRLGELRREEGAATAEYAIATMAIVARPGRTLDSAHVPEHSDAPNTPG